MTAEIAIMNREAVALAADSALTTQLGSSTPKIFPSANKIFSLSKYHPIGIMIYGNAVFMGIPWEILVKMYRNQLCKKYFSNVTEYAEDFMKFIGESPQIASAMNDEHKDYYMNRNILSYLMYVRAGIEKLVRKRLNEKGAVSENEIKEFVNKVLKAEPMKWKDCDPIPNAQADFEKRVIAKYRKRIKENINEVFQDLPLSRGQKEKLVNLASFCILNISKMIQNPWASGIVVAGFGNEDLFPSLVYYDVELVIEDKIKYRKNKFIDINWERTASVVPFAQKEMVAAFMEGIDPIYRTAKDVAIEKTFDNYAILIAESLGIQSDRQKIRKMKKIGGILLRKLSDDLHKVRENNFTIPITSTVSGLPKDELAAMAESLVSLTSFKRRVSPQWETVSGPIDVALISKGDGFIWVKRKHYFRAELNPQFHDNYYKDCIGVRGVER